MKLLLSLVAIVFVYISNVVAQASSTVSITAAQGYAIQRQCAKCNLWQCAGNVNDFLQCNGLNYCYCRADLSSDVNSLLSSRLSTDCTPGPATNDISLAISIYSQYCAQAMGDVVTTTEALPSGTGSPGTGSPVTSTTIQIETATARSGAQPSLSVTCKWISLPLVLLGQFGALL